MAKRFVLLQTAAGKFAVLLCDAGALGTGPFPAWPPAVAVIRFASTYGAAAETYVKTH